MDLFVSKAKVVFIIILMVSLNFVLFIDYKSRISSTKNFLGQEAETAANLVSGLVKRLYLADYKVLLKTKDINSAEYKSVKQLLVDCKDSSRFRFVFTFSVINDWNKIEYIVDSEPNHSKDFSPPGSTEPMFVREGILNLKSRPYVSTHDTDVYDDPKWGKFLSGYAPIVDEDGNSHLGFVEVDVPEKVVDMYLQTVYNRYLMITLIVNVICFIGLLYVVHAFYRASKLQQEKREVVASYLDQMPARSREKLMAIAFRTPKF